MRIQRRRWAPHSLLHRGNGKAADDVRRVLGISPAGRMEELERRISELERHLALVHRHFQGVQLADSRTPAVPDANGWLQMYSPDDSVVVQRDPNTKPNVIALSVAEGAAGCAAAITKNIDCDSNELAATACGASVKHASGNQYIDVHVTGAANAQQLEYYWCAPVGVAPLFYLDGVNLPRTPDTYVRLTVGDPCAGGCVDVDVPGFYPA